MDGTIRKMITFVRIKDILYFSMNNKLFCMDKGSELRCLTVPIIIFIFLKY